MSTINPYALGGASLPRKLKNYNINFQYLTSLNFNVLENGYIVAINKINNEDNFEILSVKKNGLSISSFPFNVNKFDFVTIDTNVIDVTQESSVRISQSFGDVDEEYNYNGSANSITAITVGDGPIGIAYSPSNDRLYVCNVNSGNLSVINPATNTIVGSISVGTGPAIAYSPSNDRIYVCNSGSDNVSVINPATNTVVATITVGDGPRGIEYSPSNDRLYVSNRDSDNVSVINPATNTVVARITVGDGPFEIAYSPSNDRIYVCNSGSDNVSVINPATNTVVATITVGDAPFGVAYSPSNDRIYVCNFFSDDVSIINPSTNTVVATITVGDAP
ncbi:MAG: YncE family protein, partial [bacterium]